MRIILSIFALSMFLISCQEVTIQVFRQCGVMTISDALPVQFWLADCETYNEYEAEGVHRACWCQPWNCDDEIIMQFQHTTAQTLHLAALNESDDILFNTTIAEVQSGVYQTSLTPQNEDICDVRVKLLLLDDTVVDIIAPSSWTNNLGSFDTKNATQFIEAVTSSTGIINAYQSVVIPSGVTVKIHVSVVASGTWSLGGVNISAFLADGSGNNVSTDTTVDNKFFEEPVTRDLELILTTTSAAQRLYIQLTEGIGSGTADMTINMSVGEIIYFSEESILAKSDCLDIATAHDETIFIEYSNQRNYAGLIYENDSPDTTFGIRVPSRFVHESFPEEDEAMELTSSIIITSSQQKTQRELEVKHAPYYFHKKLMQILKHQSLSINDIQWKKEENYQLNDGNKRWPLKSATCLLTEKNSPVRNVL